MNHSNSTQTIYLTQKRPFHKESLSMALAMLGPPSGRKSSANAHTVKPKIKSPSRQRCKVRPVPSKARIAKYKFSVPGPSEARSIKHKYLLFYSSCFGMRKPSDTFRLAAPKRSGGRSNTTSAVSSRGTRDERAEASPNGGPLTRLVIYSIYRFPHIKLPSPSAARRGPPQAPAL